MIISFIMGNTCDRCKKETNLRNNNWRCSNCNAIFCLECGNYGLICLRESLFNRIKILELKLTKDIVKIIGHYLFI